MREIFLAALAAMLLCTVIPAAAVAYCGKDSIPETTASQTVQRVTKPTTPKPQPTEAATQTAAEPKEADDSFDNAFNLPVLLDGGVDSMSLHDYLVGAILGEMPLSFETEALKAQAIACRTYALRQYAGRKHDPAAVCTASSCCECWVSADGVSDEQLQRAEQAVRETDGTVLTYEGKLIEATFFSCAGGRTESAADVWGSAVPYLTAVDSPGEENAPRYSDSVTETAAAFREAILSAQPTADLSGNTDTWIGEPSYTDGGGVRSIKIGGADFTGKELRRLFGLNSTKFRLTVSADEIRFETVGFGHRVGMSQYGAQAMAQNGATCTEILLHYYTGVSLTDGSTLYTAK